MYATVHNNAHTVIFQCELQMCNTEQQHFKAPFTLETNFEILFRNENFESFLSKVSEISSAKFRKIEHVLNCEI